MSIMSIECHWAACACLPAFLRPGAKFICTENIICHGIYICQPVSQSVDYELHHTNYRPTTSRPTPWKFVESECRSTVVSQVRQPVRHSAVRPPTINRQRSGPGVLFTHTRRAVTFGPPPCMNGLTEFPLQAISHGFPC